MVHCTPNYDWKSAHGTTYTHTYSQARVCCYAKNCLHIMYVSTYVTRFANPQYRMNYSICYVWIKYRLFLHVGMHILSRMNMTAYLISLTHHGEDWSHHTVVRRTFIYPLLQYHMSIQSRISMLAPKQDGSLYTEL